ncbi:MAG: hypothetical protein IPI23_12200 [Bacteroidetes bacterium]|nr:hypothetical protein [Bacteroidota bacterium]
MKTILNASAFCSSLFNGFIKVKKRKALLAISFLWLTVFNSYAQAPLDGVFNYVNGTPVFYVEVPDSNAVSQIELTLGSDATQTDIFNHIFDFEVTIGLPSGFSFSRIGNKVYLGLGTFPDPSVYYAKVRLKNSSGAWSDYYEFYGN